MDLKIDNKSLLKILFTALIFVLILKLFTALAHPLVWVGTSAFLALAIEPAVNWTSRYMPRKNRALGTLFVFIVLFGALFGIGALVLPPLVNELTILVKSAPDYYSDFLSSSDPIAIFLKDNIQILQNPDQQKLSEFASTGSAWLFSSVTGFFSSIAALFTILTLTFFMAMEGPKIMASFWKYQPEKKKTRRQELALEMYKTVTGYVGATLVRSIIAAIVTFIFLLIIKVPFALSLGIIVGIVDLIPLVGATIGAVIVIFMTLIFGGLAPALISTVFFVIYQQLENSLIQPLLFSKSINISPLVTAIAAIFGAFIGGFIGALVAIPIAASIQILVRDYLMYKEI